MIEKYQGRWLLILAYCLMAQQVYAGGQFIGTSGTTQIEGSGGGRMGASTNGQAHVRATEGPNTLYARCIVAMRLHAHARTHTHAHAHARTQFHTWKTFI